MDLKQALLAKARKLQTLADLLDDPDIAAEVEHISHVQAITPTVAEALPSAPIAAPTVTVTAPDPVVKRKLNKRGLQAQVMRFLHAGPATVTELSQCCQIHPRDVTDAVGSMRANKYAYLSENGRIELTTLGKRVAAIFVQNPRALALGPGMVAKLQQNGARPL